jgi:biopolymer transport protein ExbB
MKKKTILGLALGALCASAIASPAFAWWDGGWSYRKTVSVDTQAAGVTSPEKRFPLLVRLDSANFRFEDAKPDGSDLRFVGQDDKTPLNFHVESFDPKVGLAMVWVDLPELPANGQAKLYLYYGNRKAEAAASAPRTFDASYRAVFHFAGDTSDATANATAAQGTVGFAAGAIGQAARFTGQPLTIAASPATAAGPADGFTFETWVKPEATPTASADAALYKAQGLVIGLAAGVPYVAIGDKRAAATAAITDWSLVSVSADAKGVTLYVNGASAATLAAPLPALTGAATIGEGFTGELDETRLSGTARDAAWARASFASQGSGGRLLAFGADEQPSGQGFGYFGVIFKNVTPDAWAVIGVLALMSLASWVVMYVKGAYVGRAARADKLFQALFSQQRGDVLSGAWQQALDPQTRQALGDSPLNRIYAAGVAEFAQARAEDPDGALAEETVEAIRASLDAQQVAESQRLNRWMVLLTIAISGGPFIGLLGTVLGVMITFAAIALAGDVNVNAIAPGVSAALLATVVGLLVAIPALFGYNYIASRNAEVSAGLQVFVDRLITRFADLHRRELRKQLRAAQ